MDKLEFTTHVLGRKASNRLRNGDVSITFRSKPPITRRVEVYLDGKLLGKTDIKVSQHRVCLAVALDSNTASQCGFDTIEEQEAALKRAGFRFKPFGEYYVYQVTLLADKYEVEKSTPVSQVVEKIVMVPMVKEVIRDVPVQIIPELSESQLENLRRMIANRLILPEKPVETRIWQLRIATNIISLIRPYINIESIVEVNDYGTNKG